MGRADLTRRIKRFALQLGFEAVGVAPVSALPADKLKTWLKWGYHGSMGYMARNVDKRLDPGRVLEGACSILSVALGYYHPYPLPYDRPDRGVVSRYASGDDYHRVMERKLKKLISFIRELVPEVSARLYVDTGPVLDKLWASRSGIGWLGKHTNVLTKRKLGSWFFIGEALLDLELEYDFPGSDHCGSCTRCIEACPTEAIVMPYVLDSRRCISYLTIEHRGDITEEFRASMGNLIFGCDICQDVCPWNRKVESSKVKEFEPREGNRAPQLRRLAGMSVEEFRSAFRDSPVKRSKWSGFLRNVAIAMGNSHDPAMVPELETLLECSEPMVRRHAAWALAQIGSEKALSAIRRRRQREKDPPTREALDRLLKD